ncbi:MAG: hypothetical protein KBC50_03465 [Candidatus Pacebacteria bacterium]|nr:hypothetical protein [Candidatus Paceibacterota bacterium]
MNINLKKFKKGPLVVLGIFLTILVSKFADFKELPISDGDVIDFVYAEHPDVPEPPADGCGDDGGI